MRITVLGIPGSDGRRLERQAARKWIVIALCALALAVLGAAGSVGYLTFLRAPSNPPGDACAGGRPAGGGPVVVAAGASMTQGTLGRDWVGDLRERPEFRGYAFVNAGDNGNTSADLRERIDSDVVACDPDAVILLIGTNDVRDGVPLGEYRENLTAIIERIRSGTSARIALMSLPPLGEDLDSEINHRLRGYNAAIKEIATRTAVGHVPVNERFTGHLRNRSHRPTYDFGFGTAYWAAAKYYLLGNGWDEVARDNGLELFVDHIHLSDRGGAMVTDLAAQWLSSAEGVARNHP
ncbi:SGNH/GDSL hydrolase family protein [Streptomyces abyssomicinicus]|uniref:SGNH/GDSL hydrolase family protein n=1 Tax=Streptomyces abyssomicinicus TaxID=574929 RepID=UPI0012509C9F|nr:GDSL-type esterase/lipase family protein [Streptomyces abyssomicinicus]